MRNIIVILVLLFSVTLFSQNRSVIRDGRQVKATPKKKSIAQPWRVGASVGFSMGSNDYLGFSIAPFVGYEVVRNLELGVGVGYQYSKRSRSKQHLFNVGPMVNFYPIPELFARVKYEYFTGSTTIRATDQSHHFDENALWVGAGYRNIGGPVQFHAGLMYNVLYSGSSRIFTNGFRPIAGVSFRL
ncbi:MAG TPA: hypothetical protein VK021_03490 [Flavobacteriaceae bacterium]|nr:hypothetical protein [Flavobacteriaceae bacterium]